MDNSEFGDNTDFFALTDIVPLATNGSTSDTYKVRISGKWHFLKRPKQEFTNHPQYNAAFEKEFAIGYTLDHPNIVRYISKGRDKNGFYFLTEYVDGQTLKDFISNNPTYFKKKENIQKFVEQLLSAISYLHQKQILHLDLKPENILITNIGYDVKIVDLGFAYTDCYQFLTTGKTNLYAAPEQISNGKIDQRADIYGIGMILLYVLTQTTDKKLLSKVPQPYKSIISKCLTDNIEDRYFDISALNKDIAQSSKNKPTKYLLLLFIFMGIVLFFFIKPHLTKENEISNETRVVPTDSTPIDTIKEDSQVKKDSKLISTIQQDSQSPQNENIDISNLTPRIEKEIRGNFDKLYSKYSEADLMNQFNEVQQTYQNAVSASFEIANTLYSENPQIPINEVNALIRKELDKNTATYLNWLMQFDKKQRAKSNKGVNMISVNSIMKEMQSTINEVYALPNTLSQLEWLAMYEKKQKSKSENRISLDSIMKAAQLLVKQQYDKVYSKQLSPIDILDYDKCNAIKLTHKAAAEKSGLLSRTLNSIYPQFQLDELRPITAWIGEEITRNRTIYTNWLMDYYQEHKDEIDAFANENGISKNIDSRRFSWQ